MYTIPMSLVDFIPVFLFGIAAWLLQKDLYAKMSRGAYTLFCAGTVDVFAAGFLKALYKLLYAAGVCNFEALSSLFFPLQSIGFILAGIGLFCFVTRRSGKEKLCAAVPAAFSGTMLFVAMMVLGLLGMDLSLCVVCRRMKKPVVILCFAFSFVFCLMMGYLSSRDFTKSYMNWMAECINVLGQGLLLLGAVTLHRAGLADADLNSKKENN